MKRELQKLNVIATAGAFLCAAVSFFFIVYNRHSVISVVNSALMIVFTITLFIHGVILPVKGVKLDEKKVKAFLILGMLFAEDKEAYAEMYEDFSPDMVFKRTWSPWTMFSMLAVGLLTCIPSLYLNHNRYYLLCMLGFGFFFLVLFVLSFLYLYVQSQVNEEKEFTKSFLFQYPESRKKENNKYSKTVKGIILGFVALCVLGFFGYIAAISYNSPFSKLRRQVEQWEAFKIKREKQYKDELPGGTVTGFTDEEQDEIVSSLRQEHGEEVLYKVTDKKFFEKDEKNRYYRELTLVTAKNGSENVYVYIYRKYLSENEEYEKDKVILYSSFKSETMKKEDAFPQDPSAVSEVQNVSETLPVVNTKDPFTLPLFPTC